MTNVKIDYWPWVFFNIALEFSKEKDVAKIICQTHPNINLFKNVLETLWLDWILKNS